MGGSWVAAGAFGTRETYAVGSGCSEPVITDHIDTDVAAQQMIEDACEVEMDAWRTVDGPGH